MSSSIEAEPESKAASHASSHFIKTIQFDDWKSLGHAVALSLSPRRTVLVGRNGGGKSLLLEGIRDAVYSATGLAPQTAQPIRKFTLGIASLANPERVEFRYTWEATQATQASHGSRRVARVSAQLGGKHRCWEASSGQLLWDADDPGSLRLNHEGIAPIPFALLGGLWDLELSVAQRNSRAGQSVNALFGCLILVDHVEAVMPVRGGGRESVTVKGGKFDSKDRPAEHSYSITPTTLTRELWELFGTSAEDFAELNAVGVRLGIWQKLAIGKYAKFDRRTEDVVAEATVDGVNLGLVSDGTLRLLKILLALVSGQHYPDPLLIDEPELGIHPGLLGRLLAEFDAYGAGRQLIIATHSPQVVSWAKPEELRLVERKDERTMVRSLTEEQSARVYDYLQDQGNLGEFVYDGGLDE